MSEPEWAGTEQEQSRAEQRNTTLLLSLCLKVLQRLGVVRVRVTLHQIEIKTTRKYLEIGESYDAFGQNAGS